MAVGKEVREYREVQGMDKNKTEGPIIVIESRGTPI